MTQFTLTERVHMPIQLITRTTGRKWTAAEIDSALRVPMIVASVLVIPDLVLEEQPLRATWHAVAVAADWAIWLTFLVELGLIAILAEDRRDWFRSYPLAPALVVLTPPFAPAAVQGLRAFRLLRLLRAARGFQLLARLLTLKGLEYMAMFAFVLVVGGGLAFAEVQPHHGGHLSSWDGIWWAIGVVSTNGSNIEVTTDAAKAISVVVMLAGIGVFSLLTGAVAQRFVARRAAPRATELSDGEQQILRRLDQLSARVEAIESRLER